MFLFPRHDRKNVLPDTPLQKRPVFNRAFILTIVLMSLPFLIMKIRYKSAQPPRKITERISAYSVSLSSNGRSALMGGNQDAAWLLDVGSGRVLQNYRVGSDKVVAVDLSHDAGALAICEADGSISVWDTQAAKRKAAFPLYPKGGKFNLSPTGKKRCQIALSPDSTNLLIRDPDRGLLLLDTLNGESIRAVDKNSVEDIQWFDFLPDGKRVVWMNAGVGEFRIQNVEGGEITKIPFHDTKSNAFRLAPDSESLIIGCDRGHVYRMDIPSKKSEILFHHPDPVNSLNISDDGILLVGGGNGCISMWDLYTNLWVNSLYRENTTAIAGIHWQSAHQMLTVLDKGGRCWNWNSVEGFLTLADGFKHTGKGEIVSSESVSIRETKSPKPVDLQTLLHTPIQQTFTWNREGIDRILSDLSEKIAIPILLMNTAIFQFNYLNPIASALVLEDALKHFSLEYRLQADGTIYIGRPESLKADKEIDSTTALLDIPQLQEERIDKVECMYISDLIEKLDPERSLRFIIKDESYPRVTLNLIHPTPQQILESVLHLNGLDFGIQNQQIYIFKNEEGLQLNRVLVRNTVDESKYRIESRTAAIETYECNGKNLRGALEELRSKIDFQYALDDGIGVTVNVKPQPLVPSRILDAMLHPYGLDWVLKQDGTFRIGRIEDLEKDTALLFSPRKLASFIIAWHSRFRSTRAVYSGTDTRGDPYYDTNITEMNEKLFKTIEALRDIRKKGHSFFPNEEQMKVTNPILQSWDRITDSELDRIASHRKRLESGFTREATRVYTTEFLYRCVETWCPDDLLSYEINVLNENETLDENEEEQYFASYPGSRFRSQISARMKNPSHPRRFGADLDWFLQRGYAINAVDGQQRTIQLIHLMDVNRDHSYQFTLLEGHNTYWKQCDAISRGQVTRRIICGDFSDVSGMPVPKSVQVWDHYGSDYRFIDIVDYGNIRNEAEPFVSCAFNLNGGYFRFAYEMKLIEATVNQPVERIDVGER